MSSWLWLAFGGRGGTDRQNSCSPIRTVVRQGIELPARSGATGFEAQIERRGVRVLIREAGGGGNTGDVAIQAVSD